MPEIDGACGSDMDVESLNGGLAVVLIGHNSGQRSHSFLAEGPSPWRHAFPSNCSMLRSLYSRNVLIRIPRSTEKSSSKFCHVEFIAWFSIDSSVLSSRAQCNRYRRTCRSQSDCIAKQYAIVLALNNSCVSFRSKTAIGSSLFKQSSILASRLSREGAITFLRYSKANGPLRQVYTSALHFFQPNILVTVHHFATQAANSNSSQTPSTMKPNEDVIPIPQCPCRLLVYIRKE